MKKTKKLVTKRETKKLATKQNWTKQKQNGDLKDSQIKTLNLLIQKINVVLQNWYGMNLEYD